MRIENKALKNIERSFDVSPAEMREIMKDFRSEMEKGLAGEKSSLKMIPAYTDRPSGKEKGKFLALDLGGTNLRILELELKGNGRTGAPRIMKFTLQKKHITSTGEVLFDFLADCVKVFLKKEKIDDREEMGLGFIFSFPAAQTGIAAGRAMRWTKGFSARGVIGQDVVRLLKEALRRKNIYNINVSALANDTVGTLFAKSYEDRRCDVGIILGTGTNACYPEKAANIKKARFPGFKKERMIINIEWGNFNKLRRTAYDKQLDRMSDNPGEQILEKMVSGMYLGEVAKLVFKDLIGRKIRGFETKDMSVASSDRSAGLGRVGRILKKAGISNSALKDRQIVKKICSCIARRAARISAASAAAIIMKMDPQVSDRHTIAIDGSVYENHPEFSKSFNAALKEIFKNRSSRIKIVLSKDGSGKGAAIMAAAASYGTV